MQQISERLEGSVNSVEEETQVSDLWKLNNQFLSLSSDGLEILTWILSSGQGGTEQAEKESR